MDEDDLLKDFESSDSESVAVPAVAKSNASADKSTPAKPKIEDVFGDSDDDSTDDNAGNDAEDRPALPTTSAEYWGEDGADPSSIEAGFGRHSSGERAPSPPPEPLHLRVLPAGPAASDSRSAVLNVPATVHIDPECFDAARFRGDFAEYVDPATGRARKRGRDVLRWRRGPEGPESNAKYVTWSDGSVTLHVGGSVLNVAAAAGAAVIPERAGADGADGADGGAARRAGQHEYIFMKTPGGTLVEVGPVLSTNNASVPDAAILAAESKAHAAAAAASGGFKAGAKDTSSDLTAAVETSATGIAGATPLVNVDEAALAAQGGIGAEVRRGRAKLAQKRRGAAGRGAQGGRYEAGELTSKFLEDSDDDNTFDVNAIKRGEFRERNDDDIARRLRGAKRDARGGGGDDDDGDDADFRGDGSNDDDDDDDDDDFGTRRPAKKGRVVIQDDDEDEE